jgi:hypothetical protein
LTKKKRWAAQSQNMRGRFQLPGFVPSWRRRRPRASCRLPMLFCAFLSFLFCLWSSPHVVETRNFQQPWPAIAATATSCSHHICSILPHISCNPFPALLLCLLTLYPKIKVTARIEYDLTHRVCLYLFIHVGFSLCCFTFFFRRFDISSAVPSRFFSHECCEITFAMWLSVFCV